MADLKISEFDDGGVIESNDQVAAVRSGDNVRVQVGTAAAADLGDGPDDIPTNGDLGEAAYLDVGTAPNEIVQLDGTGALPAVSGENLTDLPAQPGSGKVFVSGTDDTAEFLNDKIAGSREIIKSTQTDSSGNENLLIELRESAATAASVGTGTHTVNIANGVFQKITATGAFTLAGSFDSTKVQSVLILAVNWGAYIINTTGFKKSGGGNPSFTVSGQDLICLTQDDQGNKYLTMLASNLS